MRNLPATIFINLQSTDKYVFQSVHFYFPTYKNAAEPATMVPKCTTLTSNDNSNSLMYARLELINQAIMLEDEAGKMQNWPDDVIKATEFTRPLTYIFKEGDNIFLDRPPLLRSAMKRSAAEMYDKLVLRKRIIDKDAE